jgi:3-methyl-2-oxobutanoate hydroxymethyltransferase
MLGLSARAPRFVRNFMEGANSVQAAIESYRNAVLNREFPAQDHSFD